MDTTEFFGTEKISKILFKLAPPVMLAQLIQALYNIVDSLFIGRYSDTGLTALSIIYPLQLLMIALAVGTGVGINTVMAAKLGMGKKKEADDYAGVGTPLAVAMWFVFATICWLIMPAYAKMSTDSAEVINDVIVYGRIVCVFSLGLYYKWQTFFFIPLGAMQTCIVPVVSFNYATRNIKRCKKTLTSAIGFGLALMAMGTLCFVSIPTQMLQVFTSDTNVIEIGRIGFRFVGISFIPMVTSLIFPVFFQAIGSSLKSSFLTVIRTVVLFVPLGFLFSRLGLNWFWMTFPVTEVITSVVGFVYYRQFLASEYVQKEKSSICEEKEVVALKESKPGVIITIAGEHGSSGKRWGDEK